MPTTRLPAHPRRRAYYFSHPSRAPRLCVDQHILRLKATITFPQRDVVRTTRGYGTGTTPRCKLAVIDIRWEHARPQRICGRARRVAGELVLGFAKARLGRELGGETVADRGPG